MCASLSCAARVGGVRPRGADALCVAFGRGHPQNVCVVCYRRPGVSREARLRKKAESASRELSARLETNEVEATSRVA